MSAETKKSEGDEEKATTRAVDVLALEAELRELRSIVYRLANGKCACGHHTVGGEVWPMPGGKHGPAVCVDSSGSVLAEVRRPRETT